MSAGRNESGSDMGSKAPETINYHSACFFIGFYITKMGTYLKYMPLLPLDPAYNSADILISVFPVALNGQVNAI